MEDKEHWNKVLIEAIDTAKAALEFYSSRSHIGLKDPPGYIRSQIEIVRDHGERALLALASIEKLLGAEK